MEGVKVLLKELEHPLNYCALMYEKGFQELRSCIFFCSFSSELEGPLILGGLTAVSWQRQRTHTQTRWTTTHVQRETQTTSSIPNVQLSLILLRRLSSGPFLLKDRIHPSEFWTYFLVPYQTVKEKIRSSQTKARFGYPQIFLEISKMEEVEMCSQGQWELRNSATIVAV